MIHADYNNPSIIFNAKTIEVSSDILYISGNIKTDMMMSDKKI